MQPHIQQGDRWSRRVLPVTSFVLLIICLLFLMACEPAPTPFPVDIPPPSTTISPTAPSSSSIRYAFASNTSGFVVDLDLNSESAQVEQLTEEINPAQLGIRYDIVAAYGDLPG